MFGWCPKTSELGRLPNCTRKHRKIVALGVMLKNEAGGASSAIEHDEVVQNLEEQTINKCSNEK